jgi:hypothetical protein
MSDLVIERLLNLPLDERATILLSALLDPIKAVDIISMDSAYSNKRAILEDLLALAPGVRSPLILTLLKEVFSTLNRVK